MERLREIDFLRAIAALSVIAIHVTANYPLTEFLPATVNQFTRFAVPLFVILSGFSLFYSDEKADGSILPKMQLRMTRTVVPYLIWTIVYVNFQSNGKWKESVDQFYQHLIISFDRFSQGMGYYHLYFFIIIIQLYLLYPLLRIGIRNYPGITLLVTFIISFASQTVDYFIQMQWMQPIPNKPLVFSLWFFMWIFYFTLGMYIAKHFKTFHKAMGSKLKWVFAAWVASVVILIIDRQLTQLFIQTVRPSVILYTCTSFCFLYALAIRLYRTNWRILKGFDWLSQHSLFIFLVHPFILSTFVIYSYTHTYLWKGNTGMALLYLTTLAGSALSSYAVSFLTFSNWLGGVTYQEKR